MERVREKHQKLGSLLLMEPIKSGAYKRALEKRGPSIHHIAIDVLNLELYLKSITHSGWLLHLASLTTIKDIQTAYLARPGFPALIEVQGKKELVKMSQTPFVNQLNLPFDLKLKRLIEPIGCRKIIVNSKKEISLKLDKIIILLNDLI